MKKQNIWKKQELSIQNEIEAMIKSADEFAEKAEKLHDFTFIAKSNSLRRTAKDKEVELKSVTDQLVAFRLQLKTCKDDCLYFHVNNDIS